MNKRGSHIGVIISFIVFMGMIVFLYSFLAPNLNFGQNKSTLINSLDLNLESALSGNLTTISVYANDTSGCVNLTGFAANAGISSLNAIVQNGSGIEETSGISGDGFYIIKDPSSKLLTIYDSPQFSPSSDTSPGVSCAALNYGIGEGNYTIGQIKTNTYLFESKIKSKINNYGNAEYGSQYQTMKTDLGIPLQNNFGFSFIYQNGTSIGTSNTQGQSSNNVYSQSFPVTYVTVNGGVQSGSLIIQVW